MPRFPALAPINMSVPAADGLVLKGHLIYPHGNTGSRYPLAVLAHQYPAAKESYAPLVADFHTLGVATLAFDLRGHGESIWSPTGVRVVDTPAAPTMEAFASAFMGSFGKAGFAHISDDIVRVAAWGMAQNFIDVGRVLLVGASVGGTGVLLAAPQIGQGLKGVLTFGAAGAPAHGSEAAQRIRDTCQRLRAPILLTTSEGDPFDGAKNARTWSEGLRHVHARIVPGNDHAMAIYYEVRTEVLAWARSALGLTAARSLSMRPVRRPRR
jgi:dienelactone hydrolase